MHRLGFLKSGVCVSTVVPKFLGLGCSNTGTQNDSTDNGQL